jgi:hypothetical protein
MKLGINSIAGYCWKCVLTGRQLNYSQTGVAKALIGLEGDTKSMNEAKAVQPLIEEIQQKREEKLQARIRPVVKDASGKRRGEYIVQYLKEGKSAVEVVDLVVKIFPDADREKLYRYVFTTEYKMRKDGQLPPKTK